MRYRAGFPVRKAHGARPVPEAAGDPPAGPVGSRRSASRARRPVTMLVIEPPLPVIAENVPLVPDAALALHQLALDTMAHGVCMFDAEHRAVLFNQQYLAMFDFSP